ncbi:MAG: hypothetical protein NC394_03205 [Bacteroides sp.]|nr:hypothetical protein [Bacteroides sp.]
MNEFDQNREQYPENSQSGTEENTAGQVSFYESSEYISPVYVTKKRGVNPLAVIIPSAAVIIAAVVAFILLMLNKPVSYRRAEKNFFANAFAAAEQADNVFQGSGSERLTVDFSMPLGDMIGLDLSRIKLEADVVSEEAAAYSLMKLMLGEEELTAEMWLDRAGGKNYIFLPDISDIYAVTEYAANEGNAADYTAYAEGLQAVIEKTSEVYFDMAGDPEAERNCEFTVNGTAYTADKAVIELKISQLAVIYKTFLENMTEDPRTADMLYRLGEYDSQEEMREDIQEFVDELQESIDGEYDESCGFRMTVYMKNDTVVGREIVISRYELGSDTTAEMFIIPSENGENGYLSYKEESDEVLYELTLSYIDEAEGALHSGRFNVNIIDSDSYNKITSSVLGSYSDLALTEEDFGGELDITLDYSEEADILSLNDQNSFNVKAVLGKEGEKKTVGITVPNICTVDLTLEPSELEFKAVPQPEPDKLAVMNGDFDTSEAAEQLIEDIFGWFIPSYAEPDHGANDYPYFPEAAENEDENENMRDDFSFVEGDWVPKKIVALGEEYGVDDEELGGYLKWITYSFSSDGVLTVTDEESDMILTYRCYFDSEDNDRILLEEDAYSSIRYDEASDSLVVSDEDDVLAI